MKQQEMKQQEMLQKNEEKKDINKDHIVGEKIKDKSEIFQKLSPCREKVTLEDLSHGSSEDLFEENLNSTNQQFNLETPLEEIDNKLIKESPMLKKIQSKRDNAFFNQRPAFCRNLTVQLSQSSEEIYDIDSPGYLKQYLFRKESQSPNIESVFKDKHNIFMDSDTQSMRLLNGSEYYMGSADHLSLLTKKTAFQEIKNFFLALKISFHLSCEKHRDNYIMRDGNEFFLERYPYILETHSSQLYKQIISSVVIPNEIVPNQIWIGDCHHAQSDKIIFGMGITHILNVTREVDNMFEEEGITYLKVPVHDYSKTIISTYFKLTYEFIEKHSYGKLLVHCVLGRSRSCSMMCMYLMKKFSKSFSEVNEMLLEKRQSAQINLGFEEQLLEFERNNWEFPEDSILDLKE